MKNLKLCHHDIQVHLHICDPGDLCCMRLDELPREIQVIIAEDVANESFKDLINLSCVSHRIRSITLFLIFRQIYISWEKLDYLLEQVAPQVLTETETNSNEHDSERTERRRKDVYSSNTTNHNNHANVNGSINGQCEKENSGEKLATHPCPMDQRNENWKYILRFVRQLTFESSSLKGEWHCGDKLARILERCPKCNSVSFISSGSTAWMKHLPCLKQVSNVTVRTSATYHSKQSNENSKQHSDKVYQFSPQHLKPFSVLNTLELDGFQLVHGPEGEPGSRIKVLSKLVLRNCRWNFPTELELLYEHPLPELVFVLEEPFMQYHFEQLFRDFVYSLVAGVESLEIHVWYKVRMEIRLAQAALNRSSLKHLTLRGFLIPGPSLIKQLPQQLEQLTIDHTHETSDIESLARLLSQAKLDIGRPSLHIELVKGDYLTHNL